MHSYLMVVKANIPTSQELYTLWELFKVSVEISHAPEMILMLTKWEQLKFVSRTEMLAYKHDLISNII